MRSTCGPHPAAGPTYRYVGVDANSRGGWDSLGDLGSFDAGYKVPRSVEFVDRPLRDDAGKARRTAVREDVISRRLAR